MRIIGPSYGALMAQVLDQETRQPIARAFVSISGIEQPAATDDQGRFKNEQIPEGTQTVNVEAPGYKSQSFPVEIPPNGQVQTEFLLSKAPPSMGVCSGIVKNPEGTPLTAVITHETDASVSPSGTNPLSGEFKVSLPPGRHSLKVTAENYLPQMVECEVEAGQSTALGVTLEKPKEAVLVENKIILPDAIYFEFGSAEIKESSLGILDQVAEILQTNPNFQQLNIDGHTDDVGSEAYNTKLSTRRAASVKTYLVRKGLDSSKLGARGFGESNLTPEGRAENRRVEFNVQAAE
jgi:outer membrane protein OmpA-like peptidoglycan-associated protein